MNKIELKRIIDQINRFHNDNWTGVDTYKILNGIDDKIANTALPFFTNTIHQLVRHMLSDNFLLIKRLQGVNYKLTMEEDWMPVHNLRQLKWSETIKAFRKSKEELIDAFQNLHDSDLDNPILKDHSTVYVSLHGHIQHWYYHLGQISQMKNAIEKMKKS